MSKADEVISEYVWKCSKCCALRIQDASTNIHNPPCRGTFKKPHRRTRMFLRGMVAVNGSRIPCKVDPP